MYNYCTPIDIQLHVSLFVHCHVHFLLLWDFKTAAVIWSTSIMSARLLLRLKPKDCSVQLSILVCSWAIVVHMVGPITNQATVSSLVVLHPQTMMGADFIASVASTAVSPNCKYSTCAWCTGLTHCLGEYLLGWVSSLCLPVYEI